VNGNLERTTGHTDPIAYDTTRPLYIGRSGECGNGNAIWDARLNGALDDIRIYNRELSQDEVSMLWGGAD
jgi:hypothetical protein